MQKSSYAEFVAECDKLLKKSVYECHEDYLKKKDYKYIVYKVLKSWFHKFGPSFGDLEILRKFSISLQENEEEFAKCSETEKSFINCIVVSLNRICNLTNSILDIADEIICKL